MVRLELNTTDTQNQSVNQCKSKASGARHPKHQVRVTKKEFNDAASDFYMANAWNLFLISLRKNLLTFLRPIFSFHTP